VKPARMTVIHNGVVLHHAKELIGATTHRQLQRQRRVRTQNCPLFPVHPPWR